MQYCKSCLYPNTKPDLTFDSEGVCNACRAYEARKKINWDDREADFKDLVASAKNHSKDYDCIIPVSGGKDSFAQTVKALEYGLNPLAVTATTDHLSMLGRANLDNISKLGVDHIEVTTNAKLRRKINAVCTGTDIIKAKKNEWCR
jgi:tRNA(Ile)-lysidine synthase TilS/MesJ